MKNIMNWEYCKKNFIEYREKDQEKILSIIERANERKKFIQIQNVSEENVSFIVEGYYEVIKELLIALVLQQGMRSGNHQCLISYFYNHYKEYEKEAYLIEELSFLRNRLEYYGEAIPFSFYKLHLKEIEEIITILLKILND